MDFFPLIISSSKIVRFRCDRFLFTYPGTFSELWFRLLWARQFAFAVCVLELHAPFLLCFIFVVFWGEVKEGESLLAHALLTLEKVKGARVRFSLHICLGQI